MLGSLIDKSFYSSHFMDVTLWEAYVRLVCQRYCFAVRNIHPGVPGTFPTFIVEQVPGRHAQPMKSVVVKFYGPLFNGLDSFHVERDLGIWLAKQSLPIRSPNILSEGQLDTDWQYLIFEHIPGVSIGQVREQLSVEDWAAVAQQVGEYLSELHRLSYYPEMVASQRAAVLPSWEGYAAFLGRQQKDCTSNHKAWNDLPEHLLDQLADFVLPAERLIDFSIPPHLIHADLTADHLLGRLVNGRWQTLAIIDWGDAMTGNILYELVALYLDLFHADKHLLDIFTAAYGIPDFYRNNFPRQAFSMTLLHQFPMPQSVYTPHQRARTLQAVAKRLYSAS